MSLDKSVTYIFQETYNYLWDRYGILLGTVSNIFLALVSITMLWVLPNLFLMMIVKTLILLYTYFLYQIHYKVAKLQQLGSYTYINKNAEERIHSSKHEFYRLGIIATLAFSILTWDTVSVIFCLLCTVYFYLGTIKIRDRDESRFKSYKMAGVTNV